MALSIVGRVFRPGILLVLWAAAWLLMPQEMGAAQRYESLVRFPATDTLAQFTFDIGRDLVLKVTRSVDAHGQHFGWDFSITDRRIAHSPNFFYECLCGHGPTLAELYAWDFRENWFPSERILPVWGYPFEIRVTCEACTVAGGDYMAAHFTGGTVQIEWRLLAVANRRQLRLSDIRRRDSSRRVP